MTEYQVIKNYSVTELIADVNRFIEKGWMPHGGVSVDGGMLYQAMMKIEYRVIEANVVSEDLTKAIADSFRKDN